MTFDFTIGVGPPEPEYFEVFEGIERNGIHERTVIGRIPNWGRLHTHRTVKDGKWSDPAVWDRGQVPGPGATVVIAHEIEYDAGPPPEES